MLVAGLINAGGCRPVPAAPPVPAQDLPAGLRVTPWRATELLSSQGLIAVLPTATPTAVFGEDSRITGTTGTNDYSGHYATESSDITITAVIAGKKRGTRGAAAEQRAFLNALAMAATFAISHDTLVLSDRSGNVLVRFVPSTLPTATPAP